MIAAAKGLGTLVWTGVRWLFAHPELLLIAALAFLYFRLDAVTEDRDRWKIDAATATTRAQQWQAAWTTLRDDVAAAEIEAARADERNRQRVRAEFATEMQRITHENTDLRSAYRGLLAQRLSVARPAAGTDIPDGVRQNTDLSGIPDLSGGTLPPAGLALVSRSDLERCSDNVAQLTGLIAAWRAAGEIDVNAETDEQAR